MFEILNTLFGWLADLTCPLYYFGQQNHPVDNPFISMIMVIVLVPFLVMVTFLPIWWFIKMLGWLFMVFSNDIQ